MICIVGAGLTGLALAHELAKRGVQHVVLEASDRPGGVIRSARVDGRVLDFGPQRFRMTASLATLVGELGLEGEVVRSPEGLPLFVYADGRLREVPFSLGALATGDMLTWRGKLRLATEPLTAGLRPDERVAAFLTRKLGREAYERLAGPLFGGLYASDPTDMVVGISMAGLLRDLGVRRSLLARFVRLGGARPNAACSFRDGMQALTDGLHAAHARSVRLGCAARRLTRAENGWRIETGGGVVEAGTVVLTCAAAAAASLLVDVAPDAAGRLGALVYNPLAVVHLEAASAGRGLGYQVAIGEELATRGVTWNDSLFGREPALGRRGLYTAFLGGARMPSVVSEQDDRLGEIAALELARVIGRRAKVLAVSRTSMPAWDTSWRALAGLALPPGIRAAASWRSRPGIPGRIMEATRLGDALSGLRYLP
ncbi:MAG TPA: protoporphyrinogen oxidase [Gemmatimonadota bacterium]|nr:protoporphyrinogen oxidase [Gemmatimonadota bacterium]